MVDTRTTQLKGPYNLYIFQKEIIENHEEVQQFNIPECLHQEQDFQAKAKQNIIAFIQGK